MDRGSRRHDLALRGACDDGNAGAGVATHEPLAQSGLDATSPGSNRALACGSAAAHLNLTISGVAPAASYSRDELRVRRTPMPLTCRRAITRTPGSGAPAAARSLQLHRATCNRRDAVPLGSTAGASAPGKATARRQVQRLVGRLYADGRPSAVCLGSHTCRMIELVWPAAAGRCVPRAAARGALPFGHTGHEAKRWNSGQAAPCTAPRARTTHHPCFSWKCSTTL